MNRLFNLNFAPKLSEKFRLAEKELIRTLRKKSGELAHAKNRQSLYLQALAGLGLLAIIVLTLMFFNPRLANAFQNLSPYQDIASSNHKINGEPDTSDGYMNVISMPEMSDSPELMAQPKNVDYQVSGTTQIMLADAKSFNAASKREQKMVSDWLARRYRVASDALEMMVANVYAIAHEQKMDPHLILGVIAIESRFNPFSESPVGAQGLMQVMPKIHQERFGNLGGVRSALNPIANIRVGTSILKEYVQATGSVEGGLKRYVGAADMETDGGYGAMVLAEYKRIKEVASGRSVSIYAVAPKSSIAAKSSVIDEETSKPATMPPLPIAPPVQATEEKETVQKAVKEIVGEPLA